MTQGPKAQSLMAEKVSQAHSFSASTSCLHSCLGSAWVDCWPPWALFLALFPQPLCGFGCTQRPTGRAGVSFSRRQEGMHARVQVAE